MVGLGRYGKVSSIGSGLVVLARGVDWFGRHVAVRQGLLWTGETGQVEVWQAGSVKVCRVESRHGVAGKVSHGGDRSGEFR